MFSQCLENIPKKKPLIHCITNYVSANDCANMLLACGASPIMADALCEVEEITSKAQALVLNTGTLNEIRLEAMLKAGKKANQQGIPLILDPVGIGASSFRQKAISTLLDTLQFTVIRGNASEMHTLITQKSMCHGVDTMELSAVQRETLHEQLINFSLHTNTILVMSGATDFVISGHKNVEVFNGHVSMGSITGTGCMLSSIIGAFCATNPLHTLDAVVAAVGAMGLCGEKAYEKAHLIGGGTGSLRTFLLDAMSLLDPNTLQGGLRYEIIS